jgi:iron complex outermembrane receptor protein
VLPGQEPPPAGRDSAAPVLEPISANVARPVVLGSASALVLELDSAETRPALDLSEALRAMPLVRVRDNSRGETHLTLRGAESRQVSVALDGVPLTIGWDNRSDLSVVPLTGATRISAVRGLSSLTAGPNVLGGVVHLQVMPTYVATPEGTSYGARAGAFSGQSLAVDASVQHAVGSPGRGALIRAGGGYRQWDFMPVAAGIDQPPTAAPGRRLNSDLKQWNGYVAGRLQGATGRWLGLSSMAFGAERGVAPELHVAQPRLWRLPVTRRWVTVVGGGLGWNSATSREGSASLRAGVDLGRFEIDEYESADYEVVTGRETGDDRTLTLKLDALQTLGWGALEASLTAAETRHDETLEPDAQHRYSQRLFSGAAELTVPLWALDDGKGIGILVGGSLDGSDTPETGGQEARTAIWDWGAKAAVTLDIPTLDGRAHVGMSRRTRAPSLRELYSGALGRFVVNPDLGPETLTAAEVGLTLGSAASRWQIVAFHHRLTDAIVRASAGEGRFQRVNRDRVSATGVELVGGIRWSMVALDGDLTLQDVGLSDPGAPEDERNAEYQPEVAGNLQLGIQLPASLTTRLRLSYVGSQYCVHPDLESDVRLEGAAWGGIEVARSWTLGRGSAERTVTIVGGVRNATDSSVYDQCGLPSPGRQFTLTIAIG